MKLTNLNIKQFFKALRKNLVLEFKICSVYIIHIRSPPIIYIYLKIQTNHLFPYFF